jgi:hypothetical protein
LGPVQFIFLRSNAPATSLGSTFAPDQTQFDKFPFSLLVMFFRIILDVFRDTEHLFALADDPLQTGVTFFGSASHNMNQSSRGVELGEPFYSPNRALRVLVYV